MELGLSITTEGQWNMTERRTAWTNLLSLELDAPLWKGAQAEAQVISTYHTRGDMADVYQDFSNINADNRLLRVAHLGLQQTLAKGRLTLFAGLRQADADYFATPLASLLTGGTTGCYPVVSCNFDMNAYPFTALGLHAVYQPCDPWVIQASLYNGVAYDTFAHSFRFRPRTDGVLSLGSVCYTRTPTDRLAFNATYMAGWNVGNHFDSEMQRRHTQAGFWATIEQPLPLTMGRIHTALGATYAHEFSSPLACRNYFNVMTAFNQLTPIGGTLAIIFNRSYYNEAHESEWEMNVTMPIGQHFSIQPAIHHYSTNGARQWIGQLRVVYEL